MLNLSKIRKCLTQKAFNTRIYPVGTYDSVLRVDWDNPESLRVSRFIHRLGLDARKPKRGSLIQIQVSEDFEEQYFQCRITPLQILGLCLQ